MKAPGLADSKKPAQQDPQVERKGAQLKIFRDFPGSANPGSPCPAGFADVGEGTFDENPPPLVESRSKNYLTMALEEIAEGKIKYKYK